ncbi:class I SAM-dependent methyltransferase [Chitinophaga lutea]
MNQETVLSPLTGRPARLSDSIDVQQIIQLYRDMGMDVAGYFAGMQQVHVYACPDTGFRFFHPASLAGNAAFYEDLQRIYPEYYPLKWEHRVAAQEVSPGNRVLDIGCGDGGFLRLVMDQVKDVQVHGLEFNAMAMKKARAKGIAVTSDRIETFAAERPASFDVVASFQVLEHVTDVTSFLQAAIACLKPGGKLIIGVPNNHPWLYGSDKLHTLNLPPHHMGLWSAGALSAIAPLFGLRLRDTRPEPLVNYYYYADYYIKTKGLASLRPILYPIVKRIFKWTRSMRKGQTILAVYEKE